ncbi:MAG: hypothetical protein COB12_05665 [Flavobacterium sp.]|nr:MAG: hypothetical protein COB12_05665 [Flavobacterium sp.]
MNKNGSKVAILVDGSFFLKRYKSLTKDYDTKSPSDVVSELYEMCMKHIYKNDSLYRILFYDCKPLVKKAHNPISGKLIDYSKTEVSIFRNELFEQLKRKRKVALRLGYLQSSKDWVISPWKTKDLLNGKIKISDLTDKDIQLNIKQKRVDIKIGQDIASLALKKSVDKIILISGDGDFVPAAKLARREGIDFVLDPMWNQIDPLLFEHIDGLRNVIPKPSYLKKKEGS